MVVKEASAERYVDFTIPKNLINSTKKNFYGGGYLRNDNSYLVTVGVTTTELIVNFYRDGNSTPVGSTSIIYYDY